MDADATVTPLMVLITVGFNFLSSKVGCIHRHCLERASTEMVSGELYANGSAGNDSAVLLEDARPGFDLEFKF